MRRRTARPATWAGYGVHTNRACCASLAPATGGHGITINGGLAVVGRVLPAPKCTMLPGARTVEHLLAALAIRGVTDAVIEVTGGEVPYMDGSAAPFVAGIEPIDLGGDAPAPLVVQEPVEVRQGDCWIRAEPAAGLVLSVTIDFPGLGRQTFDASADAAEKVAPARSFAPAPAPDSVLAFDEAGRWDRPLRFPDEAARHKWLDLFGDLMLLGRPLQGRVVAFKPSHRLNHRLIGSVLQTRRPAPDTCLAHMYALRSRP